MFEMWQLFDDRRQLIAEQAAAAQGRATSPAVAMDEINKVINWLSLKAAGNSLI